LKLKAKVKLIIKTNINTIKVKTRIKRNINTRVIRVKFRIRFKIKVVINIRVISIFSTDYIAKAKGDVNTRAKIKKESIKVVIKVNVRIISVFSIDYIVKVRIKSSYNTKSKIEFKARGIVKIKVSTKARTRIRIIEAYTRSITFRFVRIVSYKSIFEERSRYYNILFSRVRKRSSKLKVY